MTKKTIGKSSLNEWRQSKTHIQTFYCRNKIWNTHSKIQFHFFQSNFCYLKAKGCFTNVWFISNLGVSFISNVVLQNRLLKHQFILSHPFWKFRITATHLKPFLCVNCKRTFNSKPSYVWTNWVSEMR